MKKRKREQIIRERKKGRRRVALHIKKAVVYQHLFEFESNFNCYMVWNLKSACQNGNKSLLDVTYSNSDYKMKSNCNINES